MSYCRFSCDNFKSNVYAYYSDDGYVLHIASHKRIIQEGEWPVMPLLKDHKPKEWADRYQVYLQELDRLAVVPLDMPLAGKSFGFDTAEELLEFLEELARTGYHVPEHALVELRREMREETL